jgi:hypothetical protein
MTDKSAIYQSTNVVCEPSTDEKGLQQKIKKESTITVFKKTLPKIQIAQKCPWCYEYLWGVNEFSEYNGADPDYQGWVCHKKCNID